MNKIEAQAIVGNVWTGEYPSDGRLHEALRLTDIDPVEFRKLKAATRKVEVFRPKCEILTPTGLRR